MNDKQPQKTLYIRMPPSLKRRISKEAKAEGISANAWAVRCFEKEVVK